MYREVSLWQLIARDHMCGLLTGHALVVLRSASCQVATNDGERQVHHPVEWASSDKTWFRIPRQNDKYVKYHAPIDGASPRSMH